MTEANAPRGARIDVHAQSDGEEAEIRVRIGRRVVLDTSWTAETGPSAMVSALGEAIAAVARGTVPPTSALSSGSLGRKRKAKAGPAKRGTCRKCGCTDARGCPQGCAWVDATRTLCTACATHEELAKAASTAPRKKEAADV